MRLVIADTDEGRAPMFKDKARTSMRVANAINGGFVTIEPNAADIDDEWAFVSLDDAAGSAAPIIGWIETKNIAEAEIFPGTRFALVEDMFVRACARMELVANAPGGSEAPGAPGEIPEATVVADFLLAWAHIESEVKAPDPADYSNCSADFQGSDAEGPFRITSADWKAYMDNVNDGGEVVSEFERFVPNCQTACAAFLALRYSQEFTMLSAVAPLPADGPVVPSYLNVLHSHWLGVPAASRFQMLVDENNDTATVDAALLSAGVDNGTIANLLKNRAQFLVKSGNPVTVAKFFALTNEALSSGFKTAYRSILKHADFLIPPENTVSGAAPWLVVAERERVDWVNGNLKDDSGAGLAKVIDYFKSVQFETTVRDAWCGGFVGHCLKHGVPSFESTIVKSGATAAKWITWGNMRLRLHHRKDIPVGAIVVTEKLAPKSSGHVAFFSHKVSGTDFIELFGGNQSRTVSKTMRVHKNKIREIRWLDTLDPTPGDNDPTPAPGAPGVSNGEVLMLARTIFGEARSETRKGMEAVADVVMNRVRKKFFGSTVEGVCQFPSQFTCWNRTDPNFKIIKDKKPGNGDRIFDMCFDIAKEVVKLSAPRHVTPDTKHYHATSIAKPSWVLNSPSPPRKVTLREGGHIFYEGIN